MAAEIEEYAFVELEIEEYALIQILSLNANIEDTLRM